MVKNVILQEGLHILHQREIQLASNNSTFFKMNTWSQTIDHKLDLSLFLSSFREWGDTIIP